MTTEIPTSFALDLVRSGMAYAVSSALGTTCSREDIDPYYKQWCRRALIALEEAPDTVGGPETINARR